MKASTKTRLFWCIWLIAVITVIWWLSSMMAHGSVRHRVPMFVSQGLGASDLIAKQITLSPAAPYIILPPEPGGTWYFAATATDVFGQESDFSNEISLTDMTGTNPIVTLDWDASAATNTITNYTIYKGTNSLNYQSKYYAGNNTNLSMPLYGFPLTNVVITVKVSDGATNIAFASNVFGPWVNLNTTIWIATNPPSPRYFRGIGKSGNQVMISRKYF